MFCTGGLDPWDLKQHFSADSFLRKGEGLAYLGLFQNLKDLKKHPSGSCVRVAVIK